MASGLLPEFGLLTTNLYAPPGTRLAFHNAAAPLGWAVDSTLTDHTIQVTATGGGSGGVNGYSNMFNAQWTSDGHTLTVAEIPTHNHPVTDGGHTHLNSQGGANFMLDTGGSLQFSVGSTAGFNPMASATTGITVGNAGSGGTHSHTKTFNAKFITMMVAQKS